MEKVIRLSSKISSNIVLNKSRQFRTVDIRQEHFTNGTLRIRDPGYYRLVEDIEFNPNIENDCQPYESQNSEYPGVAKGSCGPFSLGFFAAITLEANSCYLDLNGHTIRQGLNSYINQRFFAVIEIGAGMFINNQGPPGLNCKELLPPSPQGVVIDGNLNDPSNPGRLGRTSHNGIHGIKARYCFIKNLIIEDFEVGGISINGGKHILMDDIQVRDSKIDVPVTFEYSTLLLLRQVFMKNYSDNVEVQRMLVRMNRVKNIIETRFLEYSRQNGNSVGIWNNFREDNDTGIFMNRKGLPDGSALYGILLHRVGVAIGDFAQEICCINGTDDDDIDAKVIVMKNCSVENLRLDGTEIIAKRKPGTTNKFEGDIRGQLFQINPDGTFKQNFLTEIQALSRRVKGDPINTNHQNNLADCSRHLDGMGHVFKGVIGFRFDFLECADIFNCTARNLINKTVPVIDVFNEIVEKADARFDEGFAGGHTRGVSISKCDRILIEGGEINSFNSGCGNCKGIDLIRGNNNVSLKNIVIQEMKASGDGMNQILRYCTCIGVHVQSENEKIKLEKIKFNNLESPMKEPTGICIDDTNNLKNIDIS